MFEYGAFHFVHSIMIDEGLAKIYLEYILINSLAKAKKVGTGVALLRPTSNTHLIRAIKILDWSIEHGE